jgi:HAD superfamily phosphoserine phosphatase-like hydrolase
MIGYLPLKQKRLKVHTMGIGDAKLKTLSNEFKNEVLGQLLLPKAVERIKWHLEQGHSVWVVSASFDFILKEWANENGVNLLTNLTKEVTNYRMMINDDVNFNGKLKVIKENIKLEYFSEIYAYGDSPGDEMMLKIATHPHYKYFSS